MIKFMIDEEGLKKDPLVADIYKENPSLLIPTRGTDGSAGYDFIYPFKESVKITHHTLCLIETYVLFVTDEPDVVGKMYPRSSSGIKKGMILANGTGIIDSDYYSSTIIDGNYKGTIKIPLINHNPDVFLHTSATTEKIEQEEPVITTGNKIAQMVFVRRLLVDNDIVVNGKRTGGIGSTGK